MAIPPAAGDTNTNVPPHISRYPAVLLSIVVKLCKCVSYSNIRPRHAASIRFNPQFLQGLRASIVPSTEITYSKKTKTVNHAIFHSRVISAGASPPPLASPLFHIADRILYIPTRP